MQMPKIFLKFYSDYRLFLLYANRRLCYKPKIRDFISKTGRCMLNYREIAAALLIFVSSARAAEPVWQPEKTWVFAVGVLNFDTKGLATWPDAGRVDAEMIDAFKKRGVREERIVFLKNADATKANIEAKFADLLGKTAPGETLVFYYAGHGGRDYNDAARPVSLVTYDTKSTWLVSEVLETIEKHFKGSNAFLFADCCHSGALAAEALKRGQKINYLVLTSAQASSRSTGNWTFTRCLVDMLTGNQALDINGDGKITLAEAARFCEDEMAFFESQLSCSAVKGHMGADIVMSLTKGVKHARVGDHCEGLDKNQWWKLKILDSKENSQFFVTWVGFEKKFDCWLGLERLRPYTPPTIPGGTACEVEWDNTWYAAKVVRSKLGLQLVHYDGYPDADDEWVPMNRIRVK